MKTSKRKRKEIRRRLDDRTSNSPIAFEDEIADLLDDAADAERLAERCEKLERGLEMALQVAFDGPAEMVGTGCAETYGQWRRRIESELRALASRETEAK